MLLKIFLKLQEICELPTGPNQLKYEILSQKESPPQDFFLQDFGWFCQIGRTEKFFLFLLLVKKAKFMYLGLLDTYAFFVVHMLDFDLLQ